MSEDIETGGTDAPLSEQVADTAVAGEVVTTIDDAGGGDEASANEAKAREMGWVPEGEWKGDSKPRKFFSAEEFLERGETILPIVQKRARDAEAKLAEADKKWEERFAKIERMNAVALQRQREQLEAKFDGMKREAVKLGDEEGYDAAEKAKAKALKELDDTAKEPEPETKDGALSPSEVSAFAEWRGENKWFQTDRKLTVLMDAEFAEVSEEMPAATFAQKLEEAKTRVAAVFPDKFGIKETIKRAGAVEGGSRIPGGGQKGRMADKLPDEAKRAAKKFVDEGLFKTVEEYAQSYFDNEAA